LGLGVTLTVTGKICQGLRVELRGNSEPLNLNQIETIDRITNKNKLLAAQLNLIIDLHILDFKMAVLGAFCRVVMVDGFAKSHRKTAYVIPTKVGI
jgi:hypothetical protein